MIATTTTKILAEEEEEEEEGKEVTGVKVAAIAVVMVVVEAVVHCVMWAWCYGQRLTLAVFSQVNSLPCSCSYEMIPYS